MAARRRRVTLTARQDTLRALGRLAIAWTRTSTWNLLEALVTRAELTKIPPRNHAAAFVVGSLGEDLRVAWEHAGYSRSVLATKLGWTVDRVRDRERGRARSSRGVRWVYEWLRECGLPRNWNRSRWEGLRRGGLR